MVPDEGMEFPDGYGRKWCQRRKAMRKVRSDYAGESEREAEAEVKVVSMEKKKNIRYRLPTPFIIDSQTDLQICFYI